jgi:hypothetical protein
MEPFGNSLVEIGNRMLDSNFRRHNPIKIHHQILVEHHPIESGRDTMLSGDCYQPMK